MTDCLDDLDFVASSPELSHDDGRFLDFISSYIDSLDEILRSINLRIHDHPELNYEEFIAHETLTSFLRTRHGWKVSPSAYGIATAFVAEFDSGREGPVVSFNAAHGMLSCLNPIMLAYRTKFLLRCPSWYWSCMWSQSDRHCFSLSSFSCECYHPEIQVRWKGHLVWNTS